LKGTSEGHVIIFNYFHSYKDHVVIIKRQIEFWRFSFWKRSRDLKIENNHVTNQNFQNVNFQNYNRLVTKKNRHVTIQCQIDYFRKHEPN